jgi:hypothetical protein
MRPALVAAGVAIYAIASAGPHPGKVVRIERALGKPQGTPRFCAVSPGDLTGYCEGKKPELGERLTVIDSRHVLAVLRIDSVAPLGSCQQGQQWMVQSKLESGALDVSDADPQIIGLIDVALDTHSAHVVKLDPTARPPGEHAVTPDNVIAVDTNGDNTPDLEFVQIKCDDAGNPTNLPTAECFEVWYPVGRRFEWLRTDRLSTSCF